MRQETKRRRRAAARGVALRRGRCPHCGRGGTWRVKNLGALESGCRYCFTPEALSPKEEEE